MKGFILKSREAQALAAGKPLVIWRLCKVMPRFVSPNGESVTFMFPKQVSMGRSELFAPFPVGVPMFGKETWHFFGGGPIYDAAGGQMDFIDDELTYKASSPNRRLQWRSSTTMPEWASRIALTLSDVKVRRPQDADEAAILSSGIEKCPKREGLPQYYTFPGGIMDHDPVQVLMDLIKAQRSNLYHFTALATPQPKNS